MELKKKIKLRTSFIKFVVELGISIIALIVINYFLFSIVLNMAYQANYSEDVIQDNFEKLKESEKVESELLTPMSSFGVYSNEGYYLYGNILDKDKKVIWDKYNTGKNRLGRGNYITSIKREEGILLIKYPLNVQYKTEKMRSIFPNAEITIFILFCVELVVLIFLLSNRFAKKINKELNSLLVATERIEEGDLDFNVGVSNIEEMDMVLRGIDKMKGSLKVALEEQWVIEKQKRDQISALTHDVKTPLTIVKGNVELLKETEITQEQKSYCNDIQENSIRMEKYIESLLVVTRNEVEYGFSNENILIREFLNSLKTQGESLCKIKNIKMVWKIKVEKHSYIVGDRDCL